MGTVYTEITLKNSMEVSMAAKKLIKAKDIHQVTLQALVDTGAATLVISEEVRQALKLHITGLKEVRLADDKPLRIKVTEPVDVHWQNRDTSCRAWVTSEKGEVLLGAIPLEDMDLIVNPSLREVVGAHGEEPVGICK
jgi:clan AA aspartic protease